jgi:tight adherence protein B
LPRPDNRNGDRRAGDLAGIAATIQRLAVLLAAGTTPTAAWGYLDEERIAAEVAVAATSGETIPDAIRAAAEHVSTEERTIWLAVAAAWSVATEAGAPLSPTLLELSSTVRDLAQSEREIEIALASPRATARLVLVLPAVGLIFGTLLGFNTIGTLVTTPIGWACLVLGVGLLVAAARWNRRMVRSARPRDHTPGLELDLLAIAVTGGGSLDRARASVASALTRFLGKDHRPDGAVDSVLDLSRRAGVPAAALLRAEAVETRRAMRAAVAERAQRLSVRLMIPLGLCVLPAFMLLSVVPLVIAVLASTTVQL